MSHYAEAFYVEPGQCFRFVSSEQGSARHCPAPVEWNGRFRDGQGRWHTVEACLEHGLDLVSGERLPAGGG